MDRRSFLSSAAATVFTPVAQPALAQRQSKVLRIAMTLSDIPLTTGQTTQGAEGVRFIGNTLYDQLFRWDLSVTERPAPLVPSLAESFTVDPATKTVWTFHLRKGAKFHDGSDFTAESVIWNFDKLLKNEAPQFDRMQAIQGANYLVGVKSYRRLDEYSVEVTMEKPDSMLFYRLSSINFSSPARWKELGGDWSKFARHPSGTGPFMLESFTPRQKAVLKKNVNYWNPARIPKVDEVVLYPMVDATTRVAALLSGQVDWVEAPPPDAIPRIQQAGFRISSGIYPHVWPIWLSYVEDSPFRDIRVRKAANLAIDRSGMVDLLGHTAKGAVGMVDVASPWFGAPQFKIEYDPDAAKKLLAEAGYGPEKPCKVKFATSQSGSGQMQPVPMSEFIQEKLNQVGFDVSIEVVDWEALRVLRQNRADGRLNNGIHGLTYSWSTQSPDFGLLGVISSKRIPPAGDNWSLYHDPVADELCDKVQAAFERKEQDQALANLHQHIVDQSMWIWVVHDLNPRAMSKTVKNFVPPQNWYVDLTTIDLG